MIEFLLVTIEVPIVSRKTIAIEIRLQSRSKGKLRLLEFLGASDRAGSAQKLKPGFSEKSGAVGVVRGPFRTPAALRSLRRSAATEATINLMAVTP